MNERALRLCRWAAVGWLLVAVSLPAHAQFGVTAGFNFDRLSDVTLNDVEANFDNTAGWHVGVWTDLSLLGVVKIRPGVRYKHAGKLFEGLSEINASTMDDFDINLVEIPILLRLGFGAPAFSPYVLAGPVIRFPANTDNTIEGDLNTPSMAGEVGVGLQLSLGSISLYPEIAYTFGLTSFIKDELIIGFATFTPGGSSMLNTAMLRLGVGL